MNTMTFTTQAACSDYIKTSDIMGRPHVCNKIGEWHLWFVLVYHDGRPWALLEDGATIEWLEDW